MDAINISEHDVFFLSFQLILSNLRGAILLVNKDNQIEFINEAFCEMFDLKESPGELLGLSSSKILEKIGNCYTDLSFSLARIEELVSNNVAVHGEEVILKSGRTSIRDFTPIIINGEGYGRLWVHQDITERKQMEEQIRQLAFFDALTSLPNRRLLNDRLGRAIAANKRSGSNGALMFLDLDNFKPLNDTYGHGVGDLLLIEVAERLKRCIRGMDTVARLGGDEFVVMLHELKSNAEETALQASVVAEKIRISLSDPYRLTIRHDESEVTKVEHHCTTSIGVVIFNGHEGGQEEILKRADAAMYQAKEAGRNQVLFYEKRS
ncbi:MAG: sensor domain-containing diguanylate cyclase [Gallionella sp.]